MDNISLKIRPATKADIPAIQKILEVAFSDYFNVLGVKIKTVTESYEDIEGDIKEKNVYVACVNNFMLAGTIRFSKAGNVCYISRFGVLPKWQSVGTGGMLLQKAEEFSIENNMSALALHTATKLSKQIRYYYNQGFYIHSTSNDKGYIRGLLVKELGKDYSLDGIN